MLSKLHKQSFSVFMSLLLVFSMLIPGVNAAELGISEVSDEALQTENENPAIEDAGDQVEDVISETDSTTEETDDHISDESEGTDVPVIQRESIRVKVRVESYNHTILPLTEIDVAPYDITHAVGENEIGNWYLENDETLAIHAIVKALEDNGFNVTDTDRFQFGQGNFITSIDGLEMNSINPYFDGWMYFVNNEFAPVGVGQFELKDNDEITLYFTTHYGTVSYSWFDQSMITVAANEEFALTLNSAGSVDDAVILVNDAPLLIDGDEVRTDSSGEATLRLTEPGEYHLSAQRMDGEFSDITRPYSKVIVQSKNEPDSGNEPDPDPETNPEEKPEPGESNVDTILSNLYRFYEEDRYNKSFFPWGVPEISWTEIVGLKASGFNLEDGTFQLPSWVDTDPGLKENDMDTTHIRYIFALLALGKDPSKAWETDRNLFAELAAQQKDDGSIGGVNKHMWAMHALDTGEKLGFNVGAWNAESKKKALTYLLDAEKQGGGFAFSGSSADPDMTGMALLTLVNYQNDSAAAGAIERAKHVLRQKQLDTAGWGSFGSENSNSIATVISGLVAIGEDPMSESWKKGDQTPLDALESFQLDNGAFTYTLGKNAMTNMMATEQSLIALQEIKTGKSAWQQFTFTGNPSPDPETPTEPEIPVKPELPTGPIEVGDVQEYNLPTFTGDDGSNEVVLKLAQSKLPKIVANRAGVKLDIPKDTKVTSSDWDKKLQVPTTTGTSESDRTKISNALGSNTLKDINAHIEVGGAKGIEFSDHVTLEFAGLGDKQAGFFDANDVFTLIPKADGSGSQDVYADSDEGNLVIKTNHFTRFVVFETVGNSPTEPEIPTEPETPTPPVVPSTETILFSIEKRTMGQGDVIPPTQVSIHEGDTAYTVLQRVAAENGISVIATGAGPTVYVKSIDGLAEFDGGQNSGWMYSVNGDFPQYSAGIYGLNDGDSLRWQYTKNLGEDLGNIWSPDEKPAEQGKPGAVKPGDKNTVHPQTTEEAASIEAAVKGIQQKLLRDGVQSEWEAIGLYRSGIKVPSAYLAKFNEALNDQVISKSGTGRMKITDVERLIMAAGAIGINPTDVDGKGFNLLEKVYNSELRTTGEDSLTFQGNNGVIFALIALDSKNYPVPENAKWSREKLVAELLKTQKSDGSWSLESSTTGSTSIDITAMALTALAPYNEQPNVKQAIDLAVSYLSIKQGATGGFQEAFVGGVSSEATAQVIIGLTANGFDPRSEAFTKNGVNLIDHLLSFAAQDGGFKHLADDRDSNGIASEQAFQALVAYDLFVNGKGTLYSFGDVSVKPVPTPDPTPTPTPTPVQFTDIAGHWAAEYIQKAVELGFVKGYENGTFKPNQSLTRAQAVSILVRALDLETDKKNPFTDTKKYAEATQAEFAAAYHHGLVKGQNGEFKPTETVTRAQMALMFYRAYEIQNGEKYTVKSKTPFADMSNYSDEAKAAVNMLYDFGMATGENGKFMPGSSTTRAHATKMLIEFLDRK